MYMSSLLLILNHLNHFMLCFNHVFKNLRMPLNICFSFYFIDLIQYESTFLWICFFFFLIACTQGFCCCCCCCCFFFLPYLLIPNISIHKYVYVNNIWVLNCILWNVFFPHLFLSMIYALWQWLWFFLFLSLNHPSAKPLYCVLSKCTHKIVCFK